MVAWPPGIGTSKPMQVCCNIDENKKVPTGTFSIMNFVKNDSILKIKDSVDVYVSEEDDNLCKIQFYHINTRQKLTIQISSEFKHFLSSLDGIHSISEIIKKFNFNLDELESIVDFLFKKGILEYPIHLDENSRYSRQINFLSDWIVGISAVEAHERIQRSHCVIFGAGAVGSSIAISLARAGVEKITIIDDKVLLEQSFERHPYFSNEEIGEFKVHALARYIKKINSNITVNSVVQKLMPATDLSYLVDNATCVINTADEPYIGHTSIKLGRYLWGKEIPLYVAGGFDAHLMSTGDFYLPGESMCVDCCSNFFTISLANWKPVYKVHESSDNNESNSSRLAGGTYSMSLFSSSYASMQILNWIAGGIAYKSKISQRGEFISGKSEIEWVKITSRENCSVCGK